MLARLAALAGVSILDDETAVLLDDNVRHLSFSPLNVVLNEDDCPDEWDLVSAAPPRSLLCLRRASTLKPNNRFARVRGPPNMTIAFLLKYERPDEWDVVVAVPPGCADKA